MELSDIPAVLLGIIRKYGLELIAFFWVIAVSFVLLKKKSDEVLYSQTYFNSIIVIIPILFIVYYTFRTGVSPILSDKIKIAKILFSLALIVGISYGVWYINVPHGDADPILNTEIAGQVMFFLNVIGLLAVVFGLIILARLLKDVAYSVEGWTGIFLRFLFYIPCLLSDLFSYIVGEFSRSPFVVYVLLAIEIVLILLYLYLPKLLSRFATKAGNKLLTEPVRLNTQRNISSLGNIYKKEKITPSFGLHNKFSLSFWVYIITMPTNHFPYNTDATILSFANHPIISYNGSKNKCIVRYAKDSLPIEFKIPLQKWVHLATVYDSNTIDFFMNGELVKSVTRQNNVQLAIDDVITVGQDNGLQGGISDIMYYARPLSRMEIRMLNKLAPTEDSKWLL